MSGQTITSTEEEINELLQDLWWLNLKAIGKEYSADRYNKGQKVSGTGNENLEAHPYAQGQGKETICLGEVFGKLKIVRWRKDRGPEDEEGI